jgi:hypothetical protein
MGVVYKTAWLAQARRIISNFATLAQSRSPTTATVTITLHHQTFGVDAAIHSSRLQRSCAHHWKLSAGSKASSYRQAL